MIIFEFFVDFCLSDRNIVFLPGAGPKCLTASRWRRGPWRRTVFWPFQYRFRNGAPFYFKRELAIWIIALFQGAQSEVVSDTLNTRTKISSGAFSFQINSFGAWRASWSKVIISPPAAKIRARADSVTRRAQILSFLWGYLTLPFYNAVNTNIYCFLPLPLY